MRRIDNAIVFVRVGESNNYSEVKGDEPWVTQHTRTHSSLVITLHYGIEEWSFNCMRVDSKYEGERRVMSAWGDV